MMFSVAGKYRNSCPQYFRFLLTINPTLKEVLFGDHRER